MGIDVTVGVAFVAGLASFLAPCVLPLVPAYLGYLSGYALTKPEDRTTLSRAFVVVHALAFVMGFTLVFVVLGSAAGAIGQVLRGHLLRYIGGGIVFVFGLALLGVLSLPFLQQEARLQWRGRPEWGLLSSLLIGMVFAGGWTPCVGPALTAILVLSADQATVGRGIFLLLAYAAGIGLPFIVAALLIDRLSELVKRLQRFLPVIQRAAGILLILVGIIIVTDSFSVIGAWLEARGIGWDLKL